VRKRHDALFCVPRFNRKSSSDSRPTGVSCEEKCRGQSKLEGCAMISVKDGVLQVETKTLIATIDRGFLTSLQAKQNGVSWIAPFAKDDGSAIELVYADGKTAGFGSGKPVSVAVHPISDICAEIRFHGWDADGVLRIRECPATGALLVEPAAYSARPGVRACRWWLRGIPREVDLVAPLYQGVKLPLADSLIRNSHWHWPILWEAGLAILQGRDGGFWVHAQDTAYRYKSLQIGTAGDSQCLGFEAEAYGPLDANLAAGGLTWRINTYVGDWQVPAEEYRNWLWQAYGLAERAAARPKWMHDIGFAVSWCNGDPAVLHALREKVDPQRVLIHFSNWRNHAYDEYYPDYTPSPRARDFITEARAMGFHVLPHCNSVDMDPSHPIYHWIRDFEYRDLIHKGRLGWGWEAGRVLSVPNSNSSLQENRSRKVMVKVHPGLSMWRSILSEEIARGIAGLSVDGVFIDVTLCSFNLHNCLVENTTSTEGMKLLIDQVGQVNNGLAVGGEGLNEITAQGLSFAQAHLFRSHHATCDGLERAGGCALNAFLFSGLCRTFGYSRLSGKTDEEVLRSRVHLSLGAIPTITGLTPQEISNPNPHVQELFALANV
jgi:hypothetical protein